jgi:hypothetical protein
MKNTVAINKHPVISLRFEGESVRKDKDGRFSLNDLHRMAGVKVGKAPKEWAKLDTTKALVEVLQDQQDSNGGISPSLEVLKTREGRAGGTWAVMSLALAYASYLSPEFRAACLKVVEERIEEEQNPELGVTRSVDRAQKSYVRAGKAPEWIQKRIQGICTRHALTSFLASRGCNAPDDYRSCTNALYIGATGVDASGLRKQMGLDSKANPRDHMTRRQLSEIALAEELAIEKAEKERSYGVEAMAHACNLAGKEVHRAVSNALRGSI